MPFCWRGGWEDEDKTCKVFVDTHNLFLCPSLAQQKHSSSFPGMTQSFFFTRYEVVHTLPSTFFHMCPITKSLTSTGNYFLHSFFPLSTGKRAFRTGNATNNLYLYMDIYTLVQYQKLFMHIPNITIFHKALCFNTIALTTTLVIQLPRVF
jgi:hypothetical protein